MDHQPLLISYPFLFISTLSINLNLSMVDLLRYPISFKSFNKLPMISNYDAPGKNSQPAFDETTYTERIHYKSLDAPNNLKPVKIFSDISGLPAHYKDIRTSLKFADISEYVYLQTMPMEILLIYLSLRVSSC